MVGPASAAQALRLCVFDTRRGQQEGEEADKILYFFPERTAPWEQLSLVGLAEGLITFTRVFSPAHPCEVMDAEKHIHVFLECEPSIWMVLVAEKGGTAGVEENIRTEALRDVLREAHSLFNLFFGPISDLLLADQPSPDAAKRSLAAFFPDYLSGRKWRLPTMADGLTERGAVQLLPLDRHSFLNVQSVIGSIQASQEAVFRIDCVLMFHDLLVSTTLPPECTSPLCTYANLRLIPSALSSTSSTTIPRQLLQSRSSPLLHSPSLSAHTISDSEQTSLSFFSAMSAKPPSFGRSKLRSLFRTSPGKVPFTGGGGRRPTQASQPSRSVSEDVRFSSHGGSNAETAPSFSSPPSGTPSPFQEFGFSLSDQPPQPMKGDAWYKTASGFLSTVAWGVEEGQAVAPRVYLKAGKERGWREMLIFQHKALTMLLLMPAKGGAAYIAEELFHTIAPAVEELQETLSRHWGGPVATHIKGHRYLLVDPSTRTIQASPPIKVTTLSKDSLALLNQVRQEATSQQIHSEGSEQDKEGGSYQKEEGGRESQEICVRGRNNAWVVLRRNFDCDLWTVMERASETLLLASEAVEQMSAKYFDDSFSSS